MRHDVAWVSKSFRLWASIKAYVKKEKNLEKKTRYVDIVKAFEVRID